MYESVSQVLCVLSRRAGISSHLRQFAKQTKYVVLWLLAGGLGLDQDRVEKKEQNVREKDVNRSE